MEVAILYICTGKYNQFFADFYSSSEQLFLSNYRKTYFVWSDDDTLANGRRNVIVYHKECEGFPADSLFRFDMFLQAEDLLKNYDYIYFFNANALFKCCVGEEILPDESGLSMGIWPKRDKQHPMFYPYERNKKSLAYIAPYNSPYRYFMGGLNGGKADVYLDMIKILAKNIRIDYDNGIIARFHDESHINAYLRTHQCKVLPTYLNMPEEFDDGSAKMIFRDKSKFSKEFNKGAGATMFAKTKKIGELLYSIVCWYL